MAIRSRVAWICVRVNPTQSHRHGAGVAAPCRTTELETWRLGSREARDPTGGSSWAGDTQDKSQAGPSPSSYVSALRVPVQKQKQTTHISALTKI